MNHLTEDQRERYRSRSLAPDELLSAGEHLRVCEECRRRLRDSGAMADPEATLLQLGSPHLTYEELEARVAGRDDGASRNRTETHLAICHACRAEYQDLSGFRDRLRPATPQPAVPPRRNWLFGRRTQIAFAALALIAVVTLSWRWLRREQPPVTTVADPPPAVPAPTAPSLELLASVDPPSYPPSVLRGAPKAAEIRFRDAMQFYVKGDYASALPALASASALDPSAAGPHFYSAICDLLEGRPDPAAAGFRRVISLGESPYLEKAYFYLAKALLRKGDAAGATVALDAAVRLKGDLEPQARELSRQVRAALQSKP